MTSRPILTCRQLIAFVADYLAGELDDFARWDFERHLDGCSSCRAYLKSYQDTMTLALAAMDTPIEDVPEDLVRTILSRVGAMTSGQ